MRTPSLVVVVGLGLFVSLNGPRVIAQDTHPQDPTHYDPHQVDPHHVDPHHHVDPPHHTDPHHHAGDSHSGTPTPHLVDGNDLHLWHTSFGLHGIATHMQGNADNDLDVDGTDFLMWQRQLGSEIASAPGSSNIPEPNSLIVAVSAGALGFAARRQFAK